MHASFYSGYGLHGQFDHGAPSMLVLLAGKDSQVRV